MVKLVSKVININKRNTCMRLCNKEWIAIDEICYKENIKRNELISNIEENKNKILGLTAAVRLFIILYFQKEQTLSRENKIGNLLQNIK